MCTHSVCMHACACMYVSYAHCMEYVYTHICRWRPEEDAGVPALSFSSLLVSLRQSPLLNLEPGCQAANPCDPPVSVCQGAGATGPRAATLSV